MMKTLSTEEIENLKPGAIVGSLVNNGQFWMRIDLHRMFVNLYDGKLWQTGYVQDVGLIQDGPNHVINTMLEGWNDG